MEHSLRVLRSLKSKPLKPPPSFVQEARCGFRMETLIQLGNEMLPLPYQEIYSNSKRSLKKDSRVYSASQAPQLQAYRMRRVSVERLWCNRPTPQELVEVLPSTSNKRLTRYITS